jgi:hypothetical protein
MASEAATTIQPGDEICVGRCLGVYTHHGIYFGDGWAVQFGGGIKDKPRASVHLARLDDFAKRGEVKVVPHEGLDRRASLQRALWLLENPPPVEYHLFGHNCEHVARWCATGRIESHQAQDAFVYNSFTGGGLVAFVEHPHGVFVGLLLLILGVFVAWLSRGPTSRFERYIGDNYPGSYGGASVKG